MNFLLKNLELELDERHLLIGEKLLEDGKVTKLYENEPHLWIAEVDGLEVEMQISPSRVKACSCECKIFEQERMCGHVAAGLLRLRRQISELVRTPKQDTNKKTFSYQKLTVNAILDSVTEDELAAFVRNFARTNKQFSLALRTKFAAKVPLADNREKFGLLLDSAIQSYRKQNDRISRPGVVQLKKLLQELLGQAEDAVALAHFGEAWAMLGAIISRFSPILKKLDSDDSSLQDQLDKAFKMILDLVKLPIPQDLREEIGQFCETEFSRPAYRLNGFSGHLLEIWIHLTKADDEASQILQTIENELGKPLSNTAYRSQLILAKLQILERPSLAREMEKFTLDCLSDPAKMLQIVDAVEPTGNLMRIKDLMEKGQRLVEDASVKARLEALLLHLAEVEGKADVIAKMARQKFLDTRDFAFYDQCKATHSGDWEQFVKHLLADLVARYDFRQNFPTIATILGREAKLDELLGLLEEQQSLDFLMRFDHFLLKTKPVELRKLYEKLLKNYLSNHLGMVASKRLRSIFEHLHRQGAENLVGALLLAIQKAFPKRQFYLEEEAGFRI